jgi:hypothetical protein
MLDNRDKNYSHWLQNFVMLLTHLHTEFANLLFTDAVWLKVPLT